MDGNKTRVPHEGSFTPNPELCSEPERQKILIVDDREENLFALEKTLARLDVDIVGATSGNEALVATLDNDFGVAILDVKMPGMDGYELAEILRGEPRTRMLPIIFNTASYADDLHTFKGYEAGCIDYIVKPCAPAILIGKVKILLELDRHRRQLEKMVEMRTSQLLHLNSVLQGIRHVNQLIVREKEPTRLIQDACRKFIQTRGFHFAFITLLDASGKLETAAEVGLGDRFSPFMEKIKRGELAPCYEKALSQSVPVLSRPPHPHCTDCPLADTNRNQTTITLRLEHDGRIYGLMTLAMPSHVADDREELSLLEEAGGDLAFALHTIEKEHRLRIVLANMRDVIWLMDMNLVPIWVSTKLTRGYTMEEIRALPLSQQMTPDSYRRVMDAYEKVITPENLTAPHKDISITLEIEFTRKDGSTTWASATFAVVRDDGGTPIGIVGSSHDISKLKNSEMALKQKTTDLTERVKELHCLYDVSRLIAEAAEPAESVFKKVVELIPQGWLYPEITRARITLQQQTITGKDFRESPWKLSANILVSGEQVGTLEVFLLKQCPARDEGPFLKEERDLIENLARRLGGMVENWRGRSQDRLARNVLELLNRKESSPDLLRDILELIQESTKIQALGIRLRKGDECAYYETKGFPEEFVQAETFLCRRDSSGEPIRDDAGTPQLDGMCGRILTRRTDPSRSFFTMGGSFWTSNTTELLRGKPESTPLCQRNRCYAEGFQSIALIPLTADEQVLGLLHLADSRPNCFNREMIQFFEGLGTSLGIALAKKRVEEALRESETLLNETGTMAKVGGWELDIASRTLRWTRETYQIHDVAQGTPLTLPEALSFYDATGRASLEEALWLCMDKEMPFDLELKFTSAEGKQLQTRVTGRAVRAADTVTKLTGTFQDITERRKLEDQLNQAMKMEAIGRLAGGVAHDFNNALTPILAVSGILLNDLNPHEPMHEDIREIQEAGERCARLTRQLLAFSRRQPMQLSPLNLNAVVGNMEKMLSRVIGEDIELVKFLDPELGNTRADEGKIEQIIANLAVNARDAMPLGGKLTIETQNITIDSECAESNAFRSSGPHVMLALSDTGEGMNEETRAHIFEPFFTTKENGKGTGLGLSTVYGIIKQSNGNIWVYSEPGKGTTFKVYLPRIEDESSTPKRPKEEKDTSRRGTETVLLVEDEASVRKTARRILSDRGYTVVEAENGKEAIKQYHEYKGPIHILVTDVIMPGMSGKEVADRLVASQPELKVLYVSGYTDNSISHHGVLDHGTHFIQKPFTSDTLASKVREVLDS